jgi:hypothetical protein
MRFASSCGSDITTMMSDAKEVRQPRPTFNALCITSGCDKTCDVDASKFHNDLPLYSFLLDVEGVGNASGIPHQLIEMWGTGNSKSRRGTRTLWNTFLRKVLLARNDGVILAQFPQIRFVRKMHSNGE